MKKEILYIVIPCYNEELVLDETIKQLDYKMKNLIKENRISKNSKVLFVNDGSNDKTWEIIKDINNKNKLFTGISLSRNYGHQNALLSGLMIAKEKANIIISMDSDLQDDINAIDEMITKCHEGNDIVYGVRSKRNKDNFFKKISAQIFYKLMNILGVELIYNHADYRLTSNKVLKELENFNEVNLFLRGIFPLIGFKYDTVYYERNKRVAGKSKYSFKKMYNLALNGITSFSIKPLRLILNTGLLILIVSIIMLITTIFINNELSKITINTYSIWIATGLNMTSLGIIGEYIGKINNETKKRPNYIILENLDNK